MYTGIVRALGIVTKLIPQGDHLSYCIDSPEGFLDDIELGASVSVDGICQTVKSIEGHCVWFDAITETLDKTTLKSVRESHKVHLERSAKFGEEVGGHLLSGHIMGTGEIIDIQSETNTRQLTIQCPPNIMSFIFSKGFIAVDGASLTVVDVKADSFTVHLIPETLQRTHFSQKQCHDFVNLEIDATTQAIVSTVVRWMENHHEQNPR